MNFIEDLLLLVRASMIVMLETKKKENFSTQFVFFLPPSAENDKILSQIISPLMLILSPYLDARHY